MGITELLAFRSTTDHTGSCATAALPPPGTDVLRGILTKYPKNLLWHTNATPNNSAPPIQESRRYLNRLSDVLFVLARVLARQEEGEVYWEKGRNREL